MAFKGEDRIICACQKVSIEEIDGWIGENPPDAEETLEDYVSRCAFNNFLFAGCETCKPTCEAILANAHGGNTDNIMENVTVENADTK